MKIHVTWNMADGSTASVETPVNPGDPHKDDKELQIAKAKAAASVHFAKKFGKTPPPNQLFAHVVKE
jgi:hypothetical protein